MKNNSLGAFHRRLEITKERGSKYKTIEFNQSRK